MNIKLDIEKQDSRTVDNGNIFHAGTLTDEQGKEFPFTVEEIKMNGSSQLNLVWCEGFPFQAETAHDPYTIDCSEQDDRRIAIANKIIEKFVGMSANTELE